MPISSQAQKAFWEGSETRWRSTNLLHNTPSASGTLSTTFNGWGWWYSPRHSES